MDAPRSSLPSKAFQSIALDTFERVVVVVLFGRFVFKMLHAPAGGVAFVVLLLLLSEILPVIFVLSRRRSEAVSRKFFDWVLGLSGATLPLLVTPTGPASLVPHGLRSDHADRFVLGNFSEAKPRTKFRPYRCKPGRQGHWTLSFCAASDVRGLYDLPYRLLACVSIVVERNALFGRVRHPSGAPAQGRAFPYARSGVPCLHCARSLSSGACDLLSFGQTKALGQLAAPISLPKGSDGDRQLVNPVREAQKQRALAKCCRC
jgi:hypothetical protein